MSIGRVLCRKTQGAPIFMQLNQSGLKRALSSPFSPTALPGPLPPGRAFNFSLGVPVAPGLRVASVIEEDGGTEASFCKLKSSLKRAYGVGRFARPISIKTSLPEYPATRAYAWNECESKPRITETTI